MPNNTDTVTAHLADGRTIAVPTSDETDWKYEVRNGDTRLGLAEWFIAQGEDCDEDREELIEGEIEDTARCEHSHTVHRVTNITQTGEYLSHRPHASVWVCKRRHCTLDAMAWVERTTGEASVWTADKGVTWSQEPPAFA